MPSRCWVGAYKRALSSCKTPSSRHGTLANAALTTTFKILNINQTPKMHLTTLALALPLALPLATALRITKITHSGPACPDAAPLEITAAEDPSALSLSIPGLSTTLEAPMFAACALDLTLEEGEVGESLVLESVEVWGRLGLGEGARGRLMASAFWADDAEVLVSWRSLSSP